MIAGKAVENGPAPPFWLEEDEVDAIGVDCSLSCDARLLRVLLGVLVREAVLDPLLGGSLVSLARLLSVVLALRGCDIQLSSARSRELGMCGGERDEMPSLGFSAAENSEIDTTPVIRAPTHRLDVRGLWATTRTIREGV